MSVTGWFEVVGIDYQSYKYPLNPGFRPYLCERYRGQWLALVHLDSDDCYHRDAIQWVRENVHCREGAVCWFGYSYLYSVLDHQLAEFGSDVGPQPFWVDMISPEALESPEALAEYRREWKQDCYHYHAPKAPRAFRGPDGMFCQLIHGANAETAWSNPNTKKKIVRMIEDKDRKAEVLSGFGIDYEREAAPV